VPTSPHERAARAYEDVVARQKINSDAPIVALEDGQLVEHRPGDPKPREPKTDAQKRQEAAARLCMSLGRAVLDKHRNAPCPCGSGRKTKRCCLALV